MSGSKENSLKLNRRLDAIIEAAQRQKLSAVEQQERNNLFCMALQSDDEGAYHRAITMLHQDPELCLLLDNRSGKTALMYAAGSKVSSAEETVSLIISKAIELEHLVLILRQESNEQKSAEDYAAEADNPDIYHKLNILKSLTIDGPDRSGNYPIHRLINYHQINQTDLLKYFELLIHDLNPNDISSGEDSYNYSDEYKQYIHHQLTKKNSSGYTPLMLAILNKAPQHVLDTLIFYLNEYKAYNPQIENILPNDVLLTEYAIKNQNIALLDFLYNKCHGLTWKFPEYLIDTLQSNESIEVIRWFIEYGLCLDHKINGSSLLHIFAANGQVRISFELFKSFELAYGAAAIPLLKNLWINDHGNSPILRAIVNNQYDIANKLIDKYIEIFKTTQIHDHQRIKVQQTSLLTNNPKNIINQNIRLEHLSFFIGMLSEKNKFSFEQSTVNEIRKIIHQIISHYSKLDVPYNYLQRHLISPLSDLLQLDCNNTYFTTEDFEIFQNIVDNHVNSINADAANTAKVNDTNSQKLNNADDMDIIPDQVQARSQYVPQLNNAGTESRSGSCKSSTTTSPSKATTPGQTSQHAKSAPASSSRKPLSPLALPAQTPTNVSSATGAGRKKRKTPPSTEAQAKTAARMRFFMENKNAQQQNHDQQVSPSDAPTQPNTP